MLVHYFCSFLLGVLFLFPCAGYAQKAISSARYATKPITPRVPRVVAGPAAFPKRPLFPSVQSARLVPVLNGVQRKSALYVLPHAGGILLSGRVSGRTFPGKTEIDGVIFDLDGTLLNSLGAWEHSGSNFVRTQGFEPPASLDEELVSLSLLDGAKLIKERYQLSQSPEEILTLTLRPIRQHYFDDILPFPGVPETLARLKAQGVKMAVATASDRELAEVALRRLGLRDYFEFIITCDEVGVGKSSPKVYEEALRRLGTPKARTLVAEDALHALQTAHKAGFPTAAIEEVHSATQRAAKTQVATYYVLSYQGPYVFKK